MHVAFVVANFPPHQGGVEKHTLSLARTLSQKGHAITVYALEARGTRVESGIPVIGMGRYLDVSGTLASPSPRDALRLAGELRAREVTHVSVHTRFFPATWLGIVAARRAGVPSVLTEHGSGHPRAGGRAMRAAALVVDKSVGVWAWRSADEVLAVSGKVADFVRVQSGTDAAICGNGVDTRWWAPADPVTDKRRVVFVARLVPEKGWRTFLDVASRSAPDVQFLLLGDGPDRWKVERALRDEGLQDRVTFLGHSEPEVVRDALRGSVLLNPSTAAEGLQTTLIEGLAAGARIVTYDVGGAAECVASGGATWVVPTGDSTGLVQALGEALHSEWSPPRELERFSWEHVAEAYVDGFNRASRARLGGRQ